MFVNEWKNKSHIYRKAGVWGEMGAGSAAALTILSLAAETGGILEIHRTLYRKSGPKVILYHISLTFSYFDCASN